MFAIGTYHHSIGVTQVGKLWNEMAGPSSVADILCRDDKQESQGKRSC